MTRAALVVVNPAGNRTRVPIEPLPFTIGRHPDNHLVIRDNRASRFHARILQENNSLLVEDLNSRHGLWVNGVRIKRHALRQADRIEFGVADSYQLLFSQEDDDVHRMLEQLTLQPKASLPGAANMAKLRALVEVARSLENALSTEEVLAAVVDAAVTVTGAERGFLLLKSGDDLDVRVARDRRGLPLARSDLRVPTRLIHRALAQRRQLLSMSFDPEERDGVRPELSVADLELRSVVCVPLVQVRLGPSEETSLSSSLGESVGLIYLDSRAGAADLSSGNRELLETLALEASTVLENARLLEQQRAGQALERELQLARAIQESLLPRRLPESGWFRVAGSSVPSRQVGGDYFDVRAVGANSWGVVVTDVSGKGVSSALLATLLQGAFFRAPESPAQMAEALHGLNRFLHERTEGEKYATIFYCTLDAAGALRYVNAGHCPPLLLRARDASLRGLAPTAVPVGLLETASFGVEECRLEPGDKIVIYTDGVSEALNRAGEFFGLRRMKEILKPLAGAPCGLVHATLMDAVEDFAGGAPQEDDVTLVVVEYRPEGGPL